MTNLKKNYYDNLCTEMYEILHSTPPKDELDFYLSYAKKNMEIFEPLCGNGRFMIPFIEKGFNIYGNDLSQAMLNKCLEKCGSANVECCDILEFKTNKKFDYIFIPSGSIGLFTDMVKLKSILQNFYNMLKEGGKLVFAVETINERSQDDDSYKVVHNLDFDDKKLLLKLKNFYDEKTQTQYMPQIYELYKNGELLQSEKMDFQVHLYNFDEMDEILKTVGFEKVKVYTDYNKNYNIDGENKVLIYECEK